MANELITIVSEETTYRFAAVATLTCLVYDYLLTLEDEVQYVWAYRLSLVNCAYHLNRVVTFASAFLQVYLLLKASDESCKEILFGLALSAVFVYIIGGITLLLRVYAIWNFSKIILVVLVLSYVFASTASLYSAILSTRSAIAEAIPDLIGGGCLISFLSKDLWICYLALLFDETLMLLLIVSKALHSSDYIISKTLRTIVNDGVIYYLCVLLLSVSNVLFLFLEKVGVMQTFFFITQTILHSILYARFVLRLRKAHGNSYDTEI